MQTQLGSILSFQAESSISEHLGGRFSRALVRSGGEGPWLEDYTYYRKHQQATNKTKEIRVFAVRLVDDSAPPQVH